MYGGWITPEGKIIDVVEKCQHARVCGYLDANDEGWIAFTNSSAVYDFAAGKSFGMSIRLNPRTVTEKAIKVCSRMIMKSEEDDIHISDMFMNCFNEGWSRGLTRKNAASKIRELLTDRKALTNDSLELFERD